VKEYVPVRCTGIENNIDRGYETVPVSKGEYNEMKETVNSLQTENAKLKERLDRHSNKLT